jgi:hypothetical protein
MLETVAVAADWSVQGMGASYKGTHTFGLNVKREEPPEDIEMRARARARQLVADCGCSGKPSAGYPRSRPSLGRVGRRRAPLRTLCPVSELGRAHRKTIINDLLAQLPPEVARLQEAKA